MGFPGMVRDLNCTQFQATVGLSMYTLGFAVTPSQANFVWARRDDRPVKPVYEELRLRGILVRYMNYAGYGDGLRVTVGTDAEIDRMIDADVLAAEKAELSKLDELESEIAKELGQSKQRD